MQSRWIEPPTPRIRSGSVASGINLLPQSVSSSAGMPHESNPPSSPINPPFVSSSQRADFGSSPDSAVGPMNPRSTSVFNLNQAHQQQHQQQPQPNMWGFNPLQQVRSPYRPPANLKSLIPNPLLPTTGSIDGPHQLQPDALEPDERVDGSGTVPEWVQHEPQHALVAGWLPTRSPSCCWISVGRHVPTTLPDGNDANDAR